MLRHCSVVTACPSLWSFCFQIKNKYYRFGPKMAEFRIEIAPFRTMDDYVLEPTRFQVPDFADPERWASRVMSNFVYYQTNYLFTIIFVHLLISLLNPSRMFVGLLAICFGFSIFVSISNNQSWLRHFKQQYYSIVR